MNVLISCEFSGIVRNAFTAKGHNAVSCDLLPSETPGYHLKMDILELLKTNHNWDMMIAFPPCTHLAISGARWFKDKKWEQILALEFIRKLLNANIPKIALENPIGIISTHIKKPDQIIQPWMFGHNEKKSTCLWLKNLPKLTPTKIMNERLSFIHYENQSKDRWKNRSRTYPGIAKAMADQWG